MSTVRQAFVSESFHPDDCVHNVWNDLMDRAYKKARALGGVFAEPGYWVFKPPLEDDDPCYHVNLVFVVSVPDPKEDE